MESFLNYRKFFQDQQMWQVQWRLKNTILMFSPHPIHRKHKLLPVYVLDLLKIKFKQLQILIVSVRALLIWIRDSGSDFMWQ